MHIISRRVVGVECEAVQSALASSLSPISDANVCAYLYRNQQLVFPTLVYILHFLIDSCK